MAKGGIIRLFLRHFTQMCKRSLRLAFRRRNRIALTLFQTNINEQIKQQFSNFEIELQVKNALAIKVNKTHLPIFNDDTKLKLSFYVTPETKVIKVKIIGLFQYKTYSFPVNINAPLIEYPSFHSIKRLKDNSINPVLSPPLNRKLQIKNENIKIEDENLFSSITIKQPKTPKTFDNAHIKKIGLDEIEKEIKLLKNKYNEEQLL
jgi:hypothetical protein